MNRQKNIMTLMNEKHSFQIRNDCKRDYKLNLCRNYKFKPFTSVTFDSHLNLKQIQKKSFAASRV